jgi:hypothetical protein
MAEHNRQYKIPEYITMEEALEDNDWGLIINSTGELKGLYIPKGSEQEEVPYAIMQICEAYFGVDWDEADTFQTVH